MMKGTLRTGLSHGLPIFDSALRFEKRLFQTLEFDERVIRAVLAHTVDDA